MQTISHPNAELETHEARTVFYDLFDGQASESESAQAVQFLCERLGETAQVESDLPDDPNALEAWMHEGVERVGRQYHDYLQARQAGGARRYFGSKSHALNFLRRVAPTKMVDGAWLYGVTSHWQDPRFTALIKTYLEELGEGLPSKNHVVLYRKLLASQGIERFDDLSDEHYIQGAIQLALAYNADRFLPEIIGFNLGYEQLPLHLLISAFELKELGIDPYYFTLHITVDNADSGHAKQAVDAVFAAMPRVGDTASFWQRVRNGYALNFLGASTDSIIESFDLEAELMAIFARKSNIGQYAHSDYRRVEGRTVNDWLAVPGDVAAFTAAMENSGWFKRHHDPRESRFWKLIQNEKARMFGVFSAYEQQIIFDWIAGEKSGEFAPNVARSPLAVSLQNHFRQAAPEADGNGDFDAEARALEARLAALPQEQTMKVLINLMSPALHHSVSGLQATRLFNEILG